MASSLWRQAGQSISLLRTANVARQSLPSFSLAHLSTSAKQCEEAMKPTEQTAPRQTVASTSALLFKEQPIETPQQFIEAIAKPRRGDLKSILGAFGEGDEATMSALASVNGTKLKEAGVPIKERRYFLWCLERFKQGQHPKQVAYDVKPKKKVRGWGPRVQNGRRVRGMKRPGEL